MFKKLLTFLILVCFMGTMCGLLPLVHAEGILDLPKPGTMVNLTPAYEPVMIKGLTVHADNPLMFDFIVDTGNDRVQGEALKQEGEKLAKYFLASLSIPEQDIWVNLSPYEKDRTIPKSLGQTDMGRDLLAQDYILKQLTASLIYPERQLGKDFWDRIYAKAHQMYGNVQVPVNTFNKVWIIADRAAVYEHNQTAFVVDRHLKVMLEEDYLAISHSVIARNEVTKQSHTSTFASNIVRDLILPELEKEVNTGKNFGNLRQIFNAIILASWYKNNLKDALLNQVYTNQSKTRGIDLKDPTVKEKIYAQYLAAYKKGVFNYIKEDVDQGETIPRKYFSGGINPAQAANPLVEKQLTVEQRNSFGDATGNFAQISILNQANFATPAMVSLNELIDQFEFSEAKKRRDLLDVSKHAATEYRYLRNLYEIATNLVFLRTGEKTNDSHLLSRLMKSILFYHQDKRMAQLIFRAEKGKVIWDSLDIRRGNFYSNKEIDDGEFQQVELLSKSRQTVKRLVEEEYTNLLEGYYVPKNAPSKPLVARSSELKTSREVIINKLREQGVSALAALKMMDAQLLPFFHSHFANISPETNTTLEATELKEDIKAIYGQNYILTGIVPSVDKAMPVQQKAPGEKALDDYQQALKEFFLETALPRNLKEKRIKLQSARKNAAIELRKRALTSEETSKWLKFELSTFNALHSSKDSTEKVFTALKGEFNAESGIIDNDVQSVYSASQTNAQQYLDLLKDIEEVDSLQAWEKVHSNFKTKFKNLPEIFHSQGEFGHFITDNAKILDADAKKEFRNKDFSGVLINQTGEIGIVTKRAKGGYKFMLVWSAEEEGLVLFRFRETEFLNRCAQLGITHYLSSKGLEDLVKSSKAMKAFDDSTVISFHGDETDQNLRRVINYMTHIMTALMGSSIQGTATRDLIPFTVQSILAYEQKEGVSGLASEEWVNHAIDIFEARYTQLDASVYANAIVILDALQDHAEELFGHGEITFGELMGNVPPLLQNEGGRKAATAVLKSLASNTHLTIKFNPDTDEAMHTQTPVQASAPAAIARDGGIDLNTKNMAMQVNRDGQGVQMNFDPAMAAQIRKNGLQSLTPRVYKITPIVDILPLAGIQK